METTVLSLAKSVLSGVAGKAKSAIAEEVALQLGVHRDLAFINDEFEMMQNFLMAADEEGGEKKVVRTWVKQVRDLGYDVEDSLLDYALHLDKKSWVRFPCTLRKRHAIANEIKELKARVEDVSHRNLRYRLIEDPSSQPTTAADRYLSSTASVFGIDGARRAAKQDNKKVDLADLITMENKERRVITVWGTSNDAGKMSTIRKVFNDPRVTGKFKCRAWVKLVNPFNPTEFLRSLVRQFYGNSVGLIKGKQAGRTRGVHISRTMASQEAELEDEYDKHVSNHKYMIVIEDLSTVSEWDWLELYLPDKKNGSRIIVCTQQIELASLCVGEPNQVSELKQFSSDQTLYIFHQKEDLAEMARTKAREEVIKMISQDSKQREIISLWGTDGPQNTAVVRRIYDGEELDSIKFQKRACITLSHPIAHQVSLVLELKSSCPVLKGNPEMRAADLIQEFAWLLRREKYLIILDGISTREEWDSLVNHLPAEECASRIVVTTKDQCVAEHCSVKKQNTYKLDVPEDDFAGDPNKNKNSDKAERARMEAREEVIKLISQDSKQREIISVWGTGGTALVRSIYDGGELDNNMFGTRAWITRSHPIADQLSLVLELKTSPDLKNNPQDMVAAGMIQEFSKLLQRQKYLIILDGISSITEWNSFVHHLPAEEYGSRIIVATIAEIVAKHCSEKSQNTFKLDIPKDDVAGDANNNKVLPKHKRYEKSMELGKNPDAPGGSTMDSRKEIGTTPDEPQLIGREKEIYDITKKLAGDGDEPCQVIFLSGMGGIGKSALVESIYNSPDIIKKFPRRAWASVSQPFDPEEFRRRIAMQLNTPSSSNLFDSVLSQRQNSSTAELLVSLEKNKHLIVVDGLSSETEWVTGVACLREAAGKGSWIIVTTREVSVPSIIENREASAGDHQGWEWHKISLKCLEDKDAFKLFKTKVLKTAEDFESDPEMLEQGKQIIRKCGGLPLAIATIGGFLSSRSATTMEWRKLNDHIGVELEINSSLQSINKMVISSYKGLSYHLKACFLYLSIFPEGHNLRRRRLVRRWIAEGYSSEMLNMSADEVGEKFFAELVSRHMIEPSKTTTSNCGEVSLCQVNSLMHAISISKANEEKLVSVLDESGFSLNSRDKVRHLVVSRKWSRDKKNALERIMDVSRMRSLTVFGEWRRFLISSKMRLLRVLDLEDTTGLTDNDLVSIGKLHHLKYLSLRGSQGIFNLPKSFGKFSNLETLDIRGTLVTKLPAKMVKLEKLSYLRAGYIPEDEDDSSIRFMDVIVAMKILSSKVCKSCISMGSADEQRRVVVNNFGPLVCFFASILLKGVDPHGIKLPKSIGKLKNLHTLGAVNVASGKSSIKELKKLTKLRKLGVTGINKKNGKDFCSAISAFSQLESLSLRSEGKNGLEDCLDDLSSGPINLQTLKLYGNLAELPQWMKQLRNLAKLNLRSTRLVYKGAMEVLENLPKLVVLCLWKDAFQEDKINIEFGAGTFKTLKSLEIKHLKGVESVEFKDTAMPELEIVRVQRCKSFAKRGFVGANSLPKLKEVWIKGTYRPELKKQLQESVTRPTLIMVN